MDKVTKYLSEIGRRGARARWDAMTAKERRDYCRRIAKLPRKRQVVDSTATKKG